MNILFLHRDFPGQFKYIAPEMASNPLNIVMFITAEDKIQVNGINKLVYKIPQKNLSNSNPYLKDYEESILHGQAAANIALSMKQKGIIPDIIYGHSWGSTMFMKDIFPDVPVLCYFEWFVNAEGAAIGFDSNPPSEAKREKIRFNNAPSLIDLYSCNAGISPTEWQKSQFPKEFQDKIKVIHDGIDTDFCKADKNAKLLIPGNLRSATETGSHASANSAVPFVKNLELTAQDEVITYATRGMEPARGFPQFMEAVEKILKKRPNAHVVIGGNDRVCYGEPLAKETYKQLMLKKLNLDMNRVHFIGELTFEDYIKVLQISSAHVYSTVPFVLSWSVLEAMSAECCVIASNTQPVQEVIEDNYNGLLFDFYNVDQLVEKIEYALDNKDKMQAIRKNARQTILDKYDLKDCLAKQIEYIASLMRK